MFVHQNRMNRSRRRGVSAVLVVVASATIMMFAAITVDVGVLYNTRAELQRTADAAALAATLELMNNDRLVGSAELNTVIYQARQEVSAVAARNNVYGASPAVASADITIGYLTDPNSTSETPATDDPSRFNAVQVTVRRDSTTNGPIDLLFSRVFGHDTSSLTADATAAYWDGVRGYRVTATTGNADLLPLALRVGSWTNLLNGTVTTGDNYSYDPATGTVSAGPDGIEELNLYPGSGAGQLPSGNFGTVDIGSPNNSTADLSRQIRYGVSESDLAYFGGELVFGPDGTLQLNGDTGLSAAIKDDLTSIIGLPRAIPLFSTVSGPGNNAMFTIVGFAGIRIMNVKLTGSMSGKNVIIQPALVLDDSVLVTDASGSSYFVYQPLKLVR